MRDSAFMCDILWNAQQVWKQQSLSVKLPEIKAQNFCVMFS